MTLFIGVILAGVVLNIILFINYRRMVRRREQELTRELQRMTWPLIDTIMTLRDERDGRDRTH